MRGASLAGRPNELAAREKVQVEVWDGFTSMLTIIDHYPETIRAEAFLLCDDTYTAKRVSEKILV